MFKPVRLLATVVFLASIALVFVGAFVIRNEVCPLAVPRVCSRSPPLGPLHRQVPLEPLPSHLTCPLVFVIIEYLAYTWYCLSYIPYARSAVLKVVGLG